jgi:hypothetical protein
MGTRHLNNIKQHRNRDPILLKVDAYGDVRLVVGRRPSVCRKAKGSVVFLLNLGKSSIIKQLKTYTNLQRLRNALPNVHENAFHIAGNGLRRR